MFICFSNNPHTLSLMNKRPWVLFLSDDCASIMLTLRSQFYLQSYIWTNTICTDYKETWDTYLLESVLTRLIDAHATDTHQVPSVPGFSALPARPRKCDDQPYHTSGDFRDLQLFPTQNDYKPTTLFISIYLNFQMLEF